MGGKGRARFKKVHRPQHTYCRSAYRKKIEWCHYPDSIIHDHTSCTHNLTEFDEIMALLPTQGATGSSEVIIESEGSSSSPAPE